MPSKLTLLFTIVLFSSVTSDCPNGTISTFSNQSWCYSFQNNQTTFYEAEKVCVNLGGHLTSIHNMFENSFLAEQTSLLFINDINAGYWIGMNDRESAGKWTWLDNSIVDFQDWEQGEPQNSNSNVSKCGTQMRGYTFWRSINCSEIRPFVCLLKVYNSTTTSVN